MSNANKETTMMATYTLRISDDGYSTEETIEAANHDIEPETVRCACGTWTGERCEWVGPKAETVLVEYMPRQHRASHAAAGNHGSYPANGAVRVRVERSCADLLLDDDDEQDWARILEDANV